MPHPVPNYPGRPALDEANMRFRRALARLYREGARHDPSLIPQLEAVVSEATKRLTTLAVKAEKAEDGSVRHRAALKAQEDKLRATLRKGVRRGDARAAEILARLDARAAGHRRPADDDR
ncbi:MULTISPECIES: hypothetical protein [unclassified Streptomyces]|uniref:hypothetical protein n=1 Tax=unclassified Streptomyces TaxID=2593676 RepID=UPI00340B0E33